MVEEKENVDWDYLLWKLEDNLQTASCVTNPDTYKALPASRQAKLDSYMEKINSLCNEILEERERSGNGKKETDEEYERREAKAFLDMLGGASESLSQVKSLTAYIGFSEELKRKVQDEVENCEELLRQIRWLADL